MRREGRPGAQDGAASLDDLAWEANESRLVGQSAGDRAADVPQGEGRKVRLAPVVELPNGLEQTNRPLLYEVLDRKTEPSITGRHGSDQGHMSRKELLLGAKLTRPGRCEQPALLRRPRCSGGHVCVSVGHCSRFPRYEAARPAPSGECSSTGRKATDFDTADYASGGPPVGTRLIVRVIARSVVPRPARTQGRRWRIRRAGRQSEQTIEGGAR